MSTSASSLTWNPLDSSREMKIMKDGKILVIRPSDQTTVVPLFCPLCKLPMKTSSDSIAYRTGLCCDKCYLFCRGKPEEMQPGSWEEYLQDRQKSSKPQITFR